MRSVNTCSSLTLATATYENPKISKRASAFPNHHCYIAISYRR